MEDSVITRAAGLSFRRSSRRHESRKWPRWLTPNSMPKPSSVRPSATSPKHKKPLNTVPHVPHNINIVLNQDSQTLLTIWFETVLMVWLTCIIDEQVQSWLRFEEVLSKSSHRFEASKIKLHEQDVIASCGLNNKHRLNKHSKLLNQWSEVMVLTFLMSFIAATAFFWFLQAKMTLTPRPARSRAVALPIPVFPPETSNQTSLKTKTKTRAGFPQCPMSYIEEKANVKTTRSF